MVKKKMKRISISKVIRRLRSYLYTCATGEDQKMKTIAVYHDGKI